MSHACRPWCGLNDKSMTEHPKPKPTVVLLSFKLYYWIVFRFHVYFWKELGTKYKYVGYQATYNQHILDYCECAMCNV